ncbi:MAG: hypothetical protein RR147_04420 [Oscillospiraceae bacterium]
MEKQNRDSQKIISFSKLRKKSLNNTPHGRLNWKHMEPQGGFGVVKGISHRVIVVKSPDRYFEEAIFVIRDDLLNDSGADRAAVLKEARRVANSYVLGTKKKGVSFISRLPAPVFAAAGAAAAGIAWFAMRLVGV